MSETIKQKFDRFFRALWIKTGRPAGIMGSPEFRTMESQYWRLVRIPESDFDEFFERFDKWPTSSEFSREISEFIVNKYPERRQEPDEGPGKDYAQRRGLWFGLCIFAR